MVVVVISSSSCSSNRSSSSLRELCFANERHSESHACVCVKGGGVQE